jgi:hypothetical protein
MKEVLYKTQTLAPLTVKHNGAHFIESLTLAGVDTRLGSRHVLELILHLRVPNDASLLLLRLYELSIVSQVTKCFAQ